MPLNRARAIEIFKFAENLKIDAMKGLNASLSSGAQVDFTIEMMIQTAVMADKLALEYGVEEEDFNKAVAEHELY